MEKLKWGRRLWAGALGALLLTGSFAGHIRAEEGNAVGTLPEGFCYVSDVIEDVQLDMRYAGENNFVGTPIDGYAAAQAVLTIEAAQALGEAAQELRAAGYRLRIYDAYRPQRAVDHFARWAKDIDDTAMKDLFYPDIDKRHLFSKGYIAEKSGHSRGSTVDLTLVDERGEAVDMGSAFDFFGDISGHGAKGITKEQAAMRKYLRTVMEKHGFRAYGKEWWHYVLKDEPYPKTYFDFVIGAAE